MKKLFTLAIALLALKSKAQLTSGNVFLRGQYVEVGIAPLGYYGSTIAAPTGYHPHCLGCVTANGIGFVADPGMTGWSTATTSHYMGDYFLPGSPFEGWDLQIKGKRVQGYGGTSGLVFSSGMSGSGSNISYTTSGSSVSGTWQGIFDSVLMTQVTTLDTNNLYFTVNLTFTNLSSSPKDSIYYFRSLDPDNDETWTGGGFPTHNVILHQGNIDSASAVSATGYSSTAAYLALGTGDLASRAVIYNAWPISVSDDLSTVYDSSYTGTGAYYSPLGTDYPGDIAIGLIMFVPHLATVDSAGDSVLRTTAGSTLHPANTSSFSYFYSFSPAATDSAIAHTKNPYGSGTDTTLGIQNANAATEIRVFPNPTKDMLNIAGLDNTKGVSVYDIMGRMIIGNQQMTRNGINTLSLQGIPDGAYILVVTDAHGHVTNRVPIRKM